MYKRLPLYSSPLICAALLGVPFVLPATHLGALLVVVWALVFAVQFSRENAPSYSWIFLFGFVSQVIGFYWIQPVIAHYGEYSFIASLFFSLVLWSYQALQFVLFHFFFIRIRNSRLARVGLDLPLAWLAAEFLFPHLIPWSAAQPLIVFPIVTQMANLFGVSFVTFILLWFCQCCVLFKTNFDKRFRRWYQLQAAGILLATVLYGSYTLNTRKVALESAEKINILLVQGDLDPTHDYGAEKLLPNIERYRKLTEKALVGREVDLIIWPESTVWFDYYVGQGKVEANTNPLPETLKPLIFGGQANRQIGVDGRSSYYNTVYAMTPDGSIESMYHKQILFPFSEKVPLVDYIPALRTFDKKVYQFIAGDREDSLAITLKDRPQPVRIGVGICFEDIWPSVFRNALRKTGADFLLTAANDAWFGSEIVSRQHLMLASWRAIELNRFLVRATNDGITAIVSPIGEAIEELPPETEGALFYQGVSLLKGETVYALVGNIPLLVVSVMVLLQALLIRTPNSGSVRAE